MPQEKLMSLIGKDLLFLTAQLISQLLISQLFIKENTLQKICNFRGRIKSNNSI